MDFLYVNVLCVCLQEQRSNLVGVKEEKPSHSPVLPPSPFSPAMRQDTHKPDNKHSEYKSLMYLLYNPLYLKLKKVTFA